MTSDDSIYRAPASALDRPSEGSARSLDDAIAGNFQFEIGEVFSEAWALTNGSKGVILGAVAISMGINVAVQGLTMLGGSEESVFFALLAFAASLAANAVIQTINAGTFLYAIKRAAGDESASFDDVISCFGMILPIFGLMLLQALFSFLGLLLFILPGIYLMVGYVLAMGLKVERGLGVWESLETSRKAIHNCWGKMFLLLIATSLVVVLGGLLTLGIGFVWLLPFGALVFGIVYRQIFGYSAGAR